MARKARENKAGRPARTRRGSAARPAARRSRSTEDTPYHHGALHDALLKAAERVVMAVRPFIRTFDSNDYWHQLASKEICLGVAWSSDYSVAQARAREDGTGAHLAFTLPKEGSNITYNAFLIPASAPHPEAAHRFLNFILEPRVIADITNDIHYGNDNLAARPFVKSEILSDPAVYPPPEVRVGLYYPMLPRLVWWVPAAI